MFYINAKHMVRCKIHVLTRKYNQVYILKANVKLPYWLLSIYNYLTTE